jgi:hypothetical protein
MGEAVTEAVVVEVPTPPGCTVRCTRRSWEFLASDTHPVLAGRNEEVAHALAKPDEVRRSRQDPHVLRFYRGTAPRW